MGRPKNFDNDPSHTRSRPTQDIQLNRFDVSYGDDAGGRGHDPQGARPADITRQRRRPERQTSTIPMHRRPRGRALQRGQGLLLRAPPARRSRRSSAPVPCGRRHRQRDRQGRRPAAGVPLPHRRGCHDDPAKKRVLVVAAEDYTGKSPNVTAGYATAPRYLDAARRRARGRGLRGRDLRHRRPAGQRRHAEPGPAPADQVPDRPRRARALRRGQLLLGRRLRPAGRHDHQPAPH